MGSAQETSKSENCRSDLFRTGLGRCKPSTMFCLRHCRTESHTHQKFSWSWHPGLAGDRVGGESWHLRLTSEEPGEPGTDWVMPAPPAQILLIRKWGLPKQFEVCCRVFKRPVAEWPQKDKEAMSPRLWFYHWSCGVGSCADCDWRTKSYPLRRAQRALAGITQDVLRLPCEELQSLFWFCFWRRQMYISALYINGAHEKGPQPAGTRLKNAWRGNTMTTLRT